MAKFHADKAFHFSDNGSDPWAVFVLIDGSDPAVYEFATDDPKTIARLEKAEQVNRLQPKARAAKTDPQPGRS